MTLDVMYKTNIKVRNKVTYIIVSFLGSTSSDEILTICRPLEIKYMYYNSCVEQ